MNQPATPANTARASASPPIGVKLPTGFKPPAPGVLRTRNLASHFEQGSSAEMWRFSAGGQVFDLCFTRFGAASFGTQPTLTFMAGATVRDLAQADLSTVAQWLSHDSRKTCFDKDAFSSLVLQSAATHAVHVLREQMDLTQPELAEKMREFESACADAAAAAEPFEQLQDVASKQLVGLVDAVSHIRHRWPHDDERGESATKCLLSLHMLQRALHTAINIHSEHEAAEYLTLRVKGTDRVGPGLKFIDPAAAQSVSLTHLQPDVAEALAMINAAAGEIMRADREADGDDEGQDDRSGLRAGDFAPRA